MQPNQKDALNWLATIEGHLKGIRRMIEEDAYCVDILKQTYAVQRAISKLEEVLVQGHLSSYVPQAVADGRADEVIAELGELFALARREGASHGDRRTNNCSATGCEPPGDDRRA